jgi:nucleotide-binding universal stress UspA family protein
MIYLVKELSMVAAYQATPLNHSRFKRIAVLTDFSHNSEIALRYAAAIARLYRAEIVLAHAYLPLPCAYSAPTPALVFETLDAEHRDLESSLLKETEASFLQGLKCGFVLMKGVPRDLLKKLKDVDLIVVGTSGETGLAKAALGSVAETIFRSSPVPVLTVGPRCAPVGQEEYRITTVLYATDFSFEAALALPYALCIAEANKAQLVLLHVADDGDLPFTFDRYMASAEPLDTLLSLVTPGLTLPSPPVRLVEFGEPGSEIPKAAKALNTSLIVIGAHAEGKFASAVSHIPGLTAYNVAAHAECPVMTVR